MSVTPINVSEGMVPFQSIKITLGAGETRQIPGTLRFIQLINATDQTKLFISFNGASFYNLPVGEQLEDFEADGVWVQNSDVAPNTVTIVTGMATLKSTRVVIDSSGTLTVQTTGTTAVSSVDGGIVSLGAKADAAATTDTGTFSLIALIKRMLTVVGFCQPSEILSGTANPISTTPVTLMAAGGSGIRNYITEITLCEMTGTNAIVLLKDGGVEKRRMRVNTNANLSVTMGQCPLRGSDNAAWTVELLGAGDVRVSSSGCQRA